MAKFRLNEEGYKVTFNTVFPSQLREGCRSSPLPLQKQLVTAEASQAYHSSAESASMSRPSLPGCITLNKRQGAAEALQAYHNCEHANTKLT